MSQEPGRVHRLRVLCLVEAVTLLVLLGVAVPLKHLVGLPSAVSVMGPVHGFVFLVLCWAVNHAVASRDIPARTGWRLVLAACVPFGGLHGWLTLGTR